MTADSVEDLGTVVLRALPEIERAAVRRCAVTPAFDAYLYDRVLRGSEGPSLQRLLDTGSVEPTSAAAERFRVPHLLRSAAWATWWLDEGLVPQTRPVPRVLRALARSLSTACRDRWPELRLRALVLSDPPHALDTFRKLFDRRDRDLDLAGCQDLLDVLVDPEIRSLAGRELQDYCADRARHLRARTLWQQSCLATLRYQPRPAVDDRLRALLDGAAAPVLRVHATGGMGKSTAIHRFIAHHCVPARVPCALVDFDFVDTFKALQYPWLLLLEWGRQLNPQMANAPFQQLLQEYDLVRATLLPTEDEQALASLRPEPPANLLAAVRPDDVVQWFVDALVEGGATGPVLLVVDTYEELALHKSGLRDLLALLAVLVAAVPAIRLVLAGRLTDAEDAQTDSPAPRLEIAPFGPDEADAYLEQRRGIADAALRRAVVARAGGLPWLLGVFADLVRYSDDVTVEVLDAVDPAVAWCLDRIVARVDGRLQWFIRYGVVPRRLSRDFAERVVMPHLVRAVAGSDTDRPDRNRESARCGTFPTDSGVPVDPAEFAELWQRLLDYAADSSWVRRPVAGSSVLVFHPTFAEPMRRLLADQGVHRALHTDAAAFYRTAAVDDPANRPQWTAEAIYHELRVDPSIAEAHWWQPVQAALEVQDWRTILRLSADLLQEDSAAFVGDGLRAAAHLEHAWATTMQLRTGAVPGLGSRWREVAADLVDAARHDGSVRTSPRWCTADAAVRIALGDYRTAGVALRGAGAGVGVEGGVLLAETYAGAGDDTAAWSQLAATLGPRDEVPWSASTLMARLAAARLSTASGDVALPLRVVSGLPRFAGADHIEAELLMASGQPGAALEVLGRDESGPGLLLRAEALLIAQSPDRALQLLDRHGAVEPARVAHWRLRGRAYDQVLDANRALVAYAQARQLAMEEYDFVSAVSVGLDSAEASLYLHDDARGARQILDELRRLPIPDESEERTRLDVFAALLDADLDGILRLLDAAVRPARVATVAAAGLTMPSHHDGYLVDWLVAALETVQPPSARIGLVAALRRRPAALAEPRLLDACAPRRTRTPLDRHLCSLQFAELIRLAGDDAAAQRIAAEAVRFLATEDPYAWWQWVSLADRAGWPIGTEAPRTLPGYVEFPELHKRYDRLWHRATTPLVLPLSAPPDPVLGPEEWGTEIAVRVATDGTVRVAVEGREPVEFGREDPFVRALTQDRDPRGKQDAVARFLAGQLAAPLLDLCAEVHRSGVHAARLLIDDPIAAAVPWEHFLVPEGDEDWCWRSPPGGRLYRQLRDVVLAELHEPRLGSRLESRLPDELWRAVRSRAGRSPSEIGGYVVIVAVEPDSPHSSQPGSDVAEAFRSLSWHGDTALGLPPGGLRPHLLYLRGAMQSLGGVPQLSLVDSLAGWAGPSSATPSPIPVDAVDRWLAAYTRSGLIPPLVVLDVDLPPRTTEALRQTMLRNDFANQLMLSGNAAAIIATGTAPDTSPTPADVAATLLQQPGSTAADLARALRAQERATPHPRAATALFATIPADALPVVWSRPADP